MAPTRPKSKSSKSARRGHKKRDGRSPKQLIAEATASLEQGDAATAATLAAQALDALDNVATQGAQLATALTLLGEIHLELGDPERARAYLLRAAETDADEDGDGWWEALLEGGGATTLGSRAEKFLWLAQLSEDGGADSVRWLERGAGVLRDGMSRLEERAKKAGRLGEGSGAKGRQMDIVDGARRELARRLASALCAVAEVYMTDLSWEADAEARCEALITEATMLAPDLADAWQTVANVRISQGRAEEARTALGRSMDGWWGKEDGGGEGNTPGFPTRVSLVRLLMEVEWEERAVEVAEILAREDDQSVEVLYLGGFGQFVLGDKARKKEGGGGGGADEDEWKGVWRSARRWLRRCLELFAEQEYEDERLGEHARELLGTLDGELGVSEGDDEEDDEWEDDEDGDGDGDEVMG